MNAHVTISTPNGAEMLFVVLTVVGAVVQRRAADALHAAALRRPFQDAAP